MNKTPILLNAVDERFLETRHFPESEIAKAFSLQAPLEGAPVKRNDFTAAILAGWSSRQLPAPSIMKTSGVKFRRVCRWVALQAVVPVLILLALLWLEPLCRGVHW